MTSLEKWLLLIIASSSTQRNTDTKRSQFYLWSTNTTSLSCPSSTDQSMVQPLGSDPSLIDLEKTTTWDTGKLPIRLPMERTWLPLPKSLPKNTTRSLKSKLVVTTDPSKTKRWDKSRTWTEKFTRRNTTHKNRRTCREVGCTAKTPESSSWKQARQQSHKKTHTTTPTRSQSETECGPCTSTQTSQASTERWDRTWLFRKTKSLPRSEWKRFHSRQHCLTLTDYKRTV